MGLGTVLSSLVALVLAMALVLGLAFAALYGLRWWQDRQAAGQGLLGGDAGTAGAQPPAMRFVRALPLGQGERLVMVEVGAEWLLLGVAPHGVTLVERYDRPAAAVDAAQSAPGARAAAPVPGASADAVATAARLRDAAGALGDRWRRGGGT